MRSKAQIAGHPLHPMLIVIPAGGFITTLVMDLMFLATDAPIWWVATLPLIFVSVLGALVAAVPGVIDLFTVARKQGALSIGVIHGLLNLVVVGLFAVNFLLRYQLPPSPDATTAPFWLSVVGVAMLGVSGWLGWVMVQSYHVGVWEHPEARDPDPYVHRYDHLPGDQRRPHDAAHEGRDELPPGEPVIP